MSKVVVGIIQKDDPLLVLLVKSKKDFGKFSGYYYPVAGHVENGEDEIEALGREIKEELGVKLVKAEKIATKESDIAKQENSWYLCKVNNFDFKINKTELEDARFFAQSEIEKIKIWPATKKVLEKYIF